MSHKMMKSMTNMAVGMVVGAVGAGLGAMYLTENKSEAKKAINKVKQSTDKLAKAGEDALDDFHVDIR